jgi:multimeric flavodoxin WrbA
VVDHDVRAGVRLDMGDGDAWPALREKVMAADILLLATPIWLGHPSSVCQRVLERLDAELSETDRAGRLLTYGKVAAVAVVGNEDGAHKVSADLFQALNDVGFSLAPGAVTYWVGEAQHGTDYQDLDETPESVASTTHTLAVNSLHLAELLRQHAYPAS